MADNLIFHIGFDLEKAVNDAGQDWSKKYAKKLEDLMAKRPVRVRFDFEKLEDVKTRLAQLKIEPVTPETKSAIKELARELQTLAKALEAVQKYSAARGGATADAVRASKIQLNAEKARSQAALTAQRAARAEANLAQARLRDARAANVGTAATHAANKAYHEQAGYLQRLAQRMAAYWSVRQVGNFLTSVREVTAQFELQRVSLGAIIQDQNRANQLFAEIKSFALTSPLKILDLTKYTKQVAAYGFETEKLFDTTKMLADISVGLGVDMSRLTLFLGQVFATGYLRASEVRQATEAGIPLVDKLAKKLEELNGRAYTAAEVMDMISKRAISYEMVEQVFKDMTSAGGEFYNMQVKQSQTLFGMWSKLGDAAAIMYDQIGNTSSINAGMKFAIRSIESMMRNWKTTARVLDSVAVAMTVYIIGLKNAAVASKALTSAVALENLAHQQQIIRTPKVVAGIIGINNAKKISTLLTNLHTKAVLGEAAATNVLTKGFWKLTAAMLANPWVAAASAIALVGVALFHFIGNTETAAERAEKLNESVAALKSTESTTKPLINAYIDLSDKAERTAEEQKKLSNVTQELAKQFPDAVVGVNKFNNEITISIGKVQKLAGLMRDVSEKNVRNDLEKSEADLEMLQSLLVKYDKFLKRGGGSFYDADKGEVIFGYWLSESDKKKIIARMAEITRQIETLNNDIINTKRELGDLPTEEAEAIERFGAWKKKLTEFNKDVSGIKVKLFDDSTIDQFGTLEEALDAAARKHKEAAESVEKYKKTLDRGVAELGQEQFDRISAERDQAQATKELSEDVLNYYNAMALLLKDMGGGRGDGRVQTLEEINRALREMYERVEDVEKKLGHSKAVEFAGRVYKQELEYLNELGREFGLKFELPTTMKELSDYETEIFNALGKIDTKVAKRALIRQGKLIDSDWVKNSMKEVDRQLKELADRISRTKTAKEFYDKILGQTGDVELAAKVAESIFGQNGLTLQKDLADQVRGMTNKIELPEGIISADNIIDYKALRQFAEANKDELGEMYSELVKISEQGQKDLAKTYEGYLKDLEKAKTYSDKRIELARYTANQIAEIEKSTLPKSEKERLTAGYREREDREAAKLEWEAFKDMPMYVEMFDDLDGASTAMLTNMRRMLDGLKGKWGEALEPTQLKEMQSRLNAIVEQLARRNPFKVIGDGLGKLRALGEEYGSLGKVENDLTTATERLVGNKAALTEALAAETAARAEYDRIVRESGADSKEAKAAQLRLSAAGGLVEQMRKTLNLTEKQVKVLQDIVGLFAEAKDEVDEGGKALVEIIGHIRNAKDEVRSMVEAWSSLGDDELWNVAMEGLDGMLNAAESAVVAFTSANPVEKITAGISAVSGLVGTVGKLFWGSKVAKANKEIKRQGELIDQLTYAYGRLEESADKVFGREYVSNYSRQLEVLRAQQAAYLKQAEAERSKGKKKDKDKIKEYEEQARETADRIKELQDDLVAHFTGQSRADAARQMAKSWIDAKASMSDTFAAIKGDYQDMIKNMLVEGAAARVIENALSKVWDDMETMLAKSDVEGAIDALVNGMDAALTQANDGMEVLWKALEARGYDLKKLLGDTDSEYTGIAKSVAGATSEEINANTAALNTQNYYMSHIDENVAAIRAMLSGGAAVSVPQSVATAAWTDWQQQAMDNYQAIARNTAETVLRCERAAVACEKMARAIKVKGSTSGFNVFLNNS